MSGRLPHRSLQGGGRQRAGFAVIFAGGLAATATAAAITATNVSGEGASLAALARASMVAAPIAVGLYAWHQRPADHFGRLLVGFGFASFLTTLAESDGELLYSIGRMAGWFVDIGLIWLILAFPSGRVRGRLDLFLLWAAVALLGVLYLPTVLIADGFPIPNQYTSCDGGCPDNAFSLLSSEPAFLNDALVPLREALVVVLFLAVTARLTRKLRSATPLLRLMLTALVVVTGVRMFLIAVGVTVRRVDSASPALDAVVWAIALAGPAMALAFLVGLLQRRLFAADALQRLGARMRGRLGQEELRAAVAEVVGDPTLEVVYWVGAPRQHWIDASGRAVEPPGPESGRCLTEVREGGRRVAGLIHDDALHDQIDFVQAVASYALIALENRRLTAQVESSLREVRESRTRIQASGDRERRRIERDLHDGAQQRLVALGIQLELTEDLIKQDRERGFEKLHALGDEVGRTLDEIQALAGGVYPSLLADRGLAEALRAAALRLPLAATVDQDGVGRYPAEVENAVYFCCLEAMQNASKHAPEAKALTIALGESDGLVFEVRDDGTGFDETNVSHGAGMTNMHDRLAAVGGSVEVRSTPGSGTVVAGRVPLSSG